MKTRRLAVLLSAVLLLPSCGLIGRKKLVDPLFTAKEISVATVSVGETTSICGSGFGKDPGLVFIGETQAQIVSWKDMVIRIRIPQMPVERYEVSVQPPGCKKKYAGKLAVRAPVQEGRFEWVEGDPAKIDSSAMEPLVLVFKPVGPSTSGIFDFNAPLAKNTQELLEEIHWACILGVQMIQLYFPGDTTTGEKDYADVSMENIRRMVGEVGKRCPGVILDIDSTYMPDGNARLARLLPLVTSETILNIGSFEPAQDKDLRIAGITDPDRASMKIEESLSFYKHPVPYVMTSWQAFDIKDFAQRGVVFPEPRNVILSLALDQRAVDGRKAYDDIKGPLPPGTRVIAATNLLNVAQIMGYSITSGDHLALGFHYSKYWPGSSQVYIPGNMFLIEKALQVAERIRRPLASLEDAAGILGVRTIPPVADAKLKVLNKTSGKTRNTTIKSRRGRGRLSVVEGAPSNTVLDAAPSYDGQELWILTDKGLFVSEDRGDTFQKIGIKSRKPFSPRAVAATADGAAWLSSPGAGILKCSGYGKSCENYTVDSGALAGDFVESLYSYGNEIYSCVYSNEKDRAPAGKGISYTTSGGKEWYVWASRDGLPYDECRTVFVEDAAVFVGFGGLKDDSQAAGMGVSHDFGKTWSLVEGIEAPVLSIAAWHDNTLIAGTKGGGAFVVNYNGTKADRIADVPETATVSKIVIDGRGWLWLATDSGILVSDSKTGPFRAFTTKDGVGSGTVTGGAYAGETFFSTRPEGDSPGGLSKFILED